MKNALACLAIVSAFTVFALQACGGDDNKSDAGPDGTTTDAASDAGQDVQQQGDGGACPNYTGSVTLCKAAIQRCNTCGAATTKFTQCEITNIDAVCNWVNGVFSSQYQNATAACATQCDVDADTACLNAALADASLSATQQKTADDYCARCGQDAGCAAALAKTLNLVDINDNVATQIDTSCTPDAGGPDSGACGAKYLNCYGTIVQKALGANPCDGG